MKNMFTKTTTDKILHAFNLSNAEKFQNKIITNYLHTIVNGQKKTSIKLTSKPFFKYMYDKLFTLMVVSCKVRESRINIWPFKKYNNYR